MTSPSLLLWWNWEGLVDSWEGLVDSLPKDFRDRTKEVKLRRRRVFHGPETAITSHPLVKDFRPVLLYVTNRY